MRKRFKIGIAMLLVFVVATTGIVFAKQATQTLNVIYDNIKIMINGKEYKPTDANGNYVEPFIYNGTTYLPVRDIANAFDKEVDWEAQTSTVILGSKNYDWLDQMGFVDYETTGSRNVFSAISSGTKMTDGMKYDRGIRFFLKDLNGYGLIENNDGSLECYQEISYLLNTNYNEFKGILTSCEDGGGRAQIKFFGDGKLLYNSPIISSGTKSTEFNVDVSNVKVLKICVEYINPSNDRGEIEPGIADARLSKK